LYLSSLVSLLRTSKKKQLLRSLRKTMEAGGAEEFFLGVDVGTGSVRAGIVSGSGELVASDTAEIQTWNPQVSILIVS